MAQSMSLVGLDVHASQTHAAILDISTGELRGVKLRMPPVEVVEFLATLPGPVRAVYEAGPTGFGLARAAVDLGIDVGVVAAGKVPRASADRVKTDKRDAERLARLLAAGELRFAFVPTVADEQFRDVIRAIEDCRGDLMRARHRLSKMLLRRDIRWVGPGSAWSQTHMRWLRGLRFEDVCSQATFVDYLSGVEMLVARRAALIAALEQVIPTAAWRRRSPRCAALGGSTRCRRPGCAPRSATGSGSGPSSCRGSWGSCRPSTPPTPNAAKARSPRPGRCTQDGCSSRPPTTTATAPPSATAWRAANTDRTPA
jgi:transposase